MEQEIIQILQAFAAKNPWAIIAYNLLPPLWAILKIIFSLTKTKKDDEIAAQVEKVFKKK